MEKKIIYIEPDYEGDWDFDSFVKLPNDEKLHIAKNDNQMHVYLLEDFATAFNNEFISDLGYIVLA